MGMITPQTRNMFRNLPRRSKPGTKAGCRSDQFMGYDSHRGPKPDRANIMKQHPITNLARGCGFEPSRYPLPLIYRKI
eukprot:1365658-Heterocapsa_arctica.AAC.1